LRTADIAAEMKITAIKTVVSANNEDIVLLEITIIDQKGIPVPDANNEITVEVTGPAKLIGMDNGNQSDVNAFKIKTRKAFEGRLLLTIQATGISGTITIGLKSAGLNPAIYSIQANTLEH